MSIFGKPKDINALLSSALSSGCKTIADFNKNAFRGSLMPQTQNSQTFDFCTAVKYLLDGKKVRSIDWNEGIYICFLGSLLVVFFSARHYEVNSFNRADFLSFWELYDETQSS